MTWDRSREHRPALGNCSNPSEKSDEAARERLAITPDYSWLDDVLKLTDVPGVGTGL